MAIKKRKFMRVVKGIVWLAIIGFALYKAGYPYIHNRHASTTNTQSVFVNKELEAIKDSEKFKAKVDNLAQQQLLTDKIAQKKASIAQLENEKADLEKQLEAKRVESLSL